MMFLLENNDQGYLMTSGPILLLYEKFKQKLLSEV
jgi:hypothetical protein